MSDVNPDVHLQALVALIASAQDQGVSAAKLVDRASEILNGNEVGGRFIPERDVEHVELELSLALAKFTGLY